MTTTGTTKRRYDNTRRRERANETRERIVTAGADLLRQSSIRNWHGVTIRAVADRAGVNERTVYRHFDNERALRDAVMHRLEQAVGVDLVGLKLEDVGDVAERVLRHVSGYPLHQPTPLDPTLVDANRRQHDALLAAVRHDAPRWPATDRTIAAAMLDVLWAVATYERLVNDWKLDRDEAIRGVAWAIGLVGDAVAEGRRPSRTEKPPEERSRR
jgi:AcrR family transcriptional regulator